MSKQPNHAEQLHYSRSHAELDLVQTLLASEETVYPWNPAEFETDAYFQGVAQGASWEEWCSQEVVIAGAVAQQVNQLWVKRALSLRFATQVPQTLLELIARKVDEFCTTNLSLADRLVKCVQDALPAWGEDDLQILARPLAYAMRDSEGEAIDNIIQTIRPVEWDNLSEIEQARLSLAIARYALDQTEELA